jgi:Uncharacterized protein conserved in bacteria
MARLGTIATLRVNRIATPGVFLDGGELGEILLPGRYVPRGTLAGEAFQVFVHRDSEDRIVATTETPHAQVGEFAFLRVTSINPRVGAFLDWGLSKDLLLPMREQAKPVRVGDWVIAHVFIDPRTDRIVATTRLERHLHRTPPDYRDGQAVQALIYGETELGFKAIVEDTHRGLLYRRGLPHIPAIGEKLTAYIHAVRDDGKIDLTLDEPGYQRVAPLARRILDELAAAGGRLPLNDASPPESIRETFGVSKKAFKQAIGALYRDRVILIEEDGIRLPNTRPAIRKIRAPGTPPPPPEA